MQARLDQVSRFLPDGRLKSTVQARLERVSPYRPDGRLKVQGDDDA